MDPRLLNHLKMCKLNQRRYKKLNKIINGMTKGCDTGDQLITKFANKCYGTEEDRELAKFQAKTFMEALFGNIDTVLNNGAEVAIEQLLRKKFPKAKGNFIDVEDVQKRKSTKFSARLHEPDNEEHMEDHPMWTKKIKNYLVGPTLGVGGTAKVKLAWNTETKKKVAMKILQPKYASNAQKEIDILKELNHKNIVRVYDCFKNVMWGGKRTTIFAIEYANQGELIEYLMYTSQFEDDLARWFFVSLTEGMEYCHGMGVAHRDLKHDNCLLGEEFTLKITDFGFAKHFYDDQLMKTAIGTAQYAAPEILAGKKYSDAVDIFSMGVMLFIALAGSQPWRKADPRSDRWYKMVHAGKWKEFFKYHTRSHKFTDGQQNILMGLLEPNPAKRWTLKNIQRCKWFNGKKIGQNEAAFRLKERKRTVDDKKFKSMRPGVKQHRKAVDIFSKKLPYIYFQPPPRLSFVTAKKAEWVLEDITNAITGIKGTIKEEDEAKNKEKYKISFHVNKPVETGRYVDRKTREKEYEHVRVFASVQMWTLPGQHEALVDREKTLSAADKKDLTKEQKDALAKSIPPIKSIAIFRAEGGGEIKYLFPAIYSDILQRLPAELISKDVMDDDDIKQE